MSLRSAQAANKLRRQLRALTADLAAVSAFLSDDCIAAIRAENPSAPVADELLTLRASAQKSLKDYHAATRLSDRDLLASGPQFVEQASLDLLRIQEMVTALDPTG